MVILECKQGTPEWHRARLGIPTSSCFKNILTSTGKPSTSATDYMNQLLAEWMSGKNSDVYTNEHMERGKELEDQAASYYAVTSDNPLSAVGFVFLDDRMLVGASPDRLISDDGGLEIKCPAAKTHVKYLRAKKIPSEYLVQVQGCMWVTGRKWWDFLSYHPDLPPLIVRAERDEKFISGLSSAVEAFLKKMLKAREELSYDYGVSAA